MAAGGQPSAAETGAENEETKQSIQNSEEVGGIADGSGNRGHMENAGNRGNSGANSSSNPAVADKVTGVGDATIELVGIPERGNRVGAGGSDLLAVGEGGVNEKRNLANDLLADSNSRDIRAISDERDRGGEKVGGGGVGEVREVNANVGKPKNANKKKPPALAIYDPFANVGKVTARILPMPTLANRPQVLNLNELKWTRPAGKPPQPKGFYWQASGSKTDKAEAKKKRLLIGWTLVRNGKCQGCGERYRPPVVYLKGEAWASLKGESIERQKAEIKLLLGNCQRRLNDLRCPECLPGDHGQMRITGTAS